MGECGLTLEPLIRHVSRARVGAPPPLKSGLLVILDVNGVLQYRDSHKRSNRQTPRRAPDFRYAKYTCWLRPARAGEPRAGTERQEAESRSSTLASRPVRDQIYFLFSREKCTPDPQGKKTWSTLKDLTKVWEIPDCAFDATNSVIVDDGAAKLRLQPHNLIHVSEFVPEGESLAVVRKSGTSGTDDKAEASTVKIDFEKDETLVWVALYLEHVSNAGVLVGDVREKIRELPFSAFIKEHADEFDALKAQIGWARDRIAYGRRQKLERQAATQLKDEDLSESLARVQI
ncbi:hypothetical protein FVE85_6338 [Porphyridium purpureum]|uniref:FCP1 homology domain-containing protein n=1 Tax=Porphyridium purpureum TaxID=35688 RepID=A0A5J4Z7E8_PORPP|nr:hypothetical protein FVE85_6338 [Porphyridium purpureum]|eukprot:POR9719..scf295_1